MTKVEFYVDGALKSTDTTSPYSYSWDSTSVANGSHSLTAKAYDAALNVGTSAAVNVTVNNPTGTDISGWTVTQANATVVYTIPAGTVIPANGYVVIGRDATKAAFQTFWGVTLASNVVYLTTAGAFPQINGSENYTLKNASGTIIDGPTISTLSSANRVAQAHRSLHRRQHHLELEHRRHDDRHARHRRRRRLRQRRRHQRILRRRGHRQLHLRVRRAAQRQVVPRNERSSPQRHASAETSLRPSVSLWFNAFECRPVLLTCERLTKSYTSRPLFNDLSFSLFEGDHVGLVGPNGSGKSTLMKIVAGEEEPDSGNRAVRKGVRIGYVPQDPVFAHGKTIEEVLLEALENDHILDDYDKQSRIAIALGKSGFMDRTQDTATLSGGWRKRLAIARELAREPDVMLLDEPTNHLDVDAILWLEGLLKSEPKAFVVVSHDRYFLENTAQAHARTESRLRRRPAPGQRPLLRLPRTPRRAPAQRSRVPGNARQPRAPRSGMAAPRPESAHDEIEVAHPERRGI